MNLAEMRNSHRQRAGHNETPITDPNQASPDRGQLINRDEEEEDESPDQLDRGFRSHSAN